MSVSRDQERQILRWGGMAGLMGTVLLIGSAVVIGIDGLPDASDVETLTDYADIESGRIVEHFLYLGALMGFALHTFVLNRRLRADHPAAALFGTVFAGFGLVIMAASSLLHVSTAPLAELYTDAETSAGDKQNIEYAWHGAQSVFDTMLATGVLLVPIGIALFGVAMRGSTAFGPRVGVLTMVLGIAGATAGAIAIVDPGSMISAIGVIVVALFHLVAGWRTMTIGDNDMAIDLTAAEPIAEHSA